MEIKKLKCNKCGTDLMINPQIKHFVCTSCGSSLTIKISGNVIYTEVVKKNSKNYIDNSQIMLLEKEIERLDRVWLIERDKYKIRTKYNEHLPNDSSAIMSVIAGIILLIFLFYFFKIGYFITSMIGGVAELYMGLFGWLPTFFIAFVVIIIIFVVGGTGSTLIKTDKYNEAKKIYEGKRNDLITQLNNKKAQTL